MPLTGVTVVVCTHGKERASQTMKCIDSVRKQTLPPEEIILVLDDPDRNLATFYMRHVSSDVAIISPEGHGLGNARNSGVRRSTGDILAFIDDDAYADSKWLENLVTNYRDVHAIGVGGLIQPIWENGRPRWFPEELDWIVGCSYKGLPTQKSVVRNPIGCNMSFVREAFERVGYFRLVSRVDFTLLAADEAEFSIRLLRNMPETRIIYDPSAVVYHRVPRYRSTFRYFVKRSFYEGLSKRILQTVEPRSLSLETRYLAGLLGVSIISRLKHIAEPGTLPQLFALLVSISLVMVGYVCGMFSSPRWAYAGYETNGKSS